MKKTLFISLFALCVNVIAFSQITIGTGTTINQSLPVEPYYGYSYTQSIYLASEIGASGDITTLSWHYKGGTNLSNTDDWVVYIGHTTKSSFSSTSDWVPVASMTQVWSGTITLSGTTDQWITIDITDFTYNGTDNIVVAVDENSSSYNSGSDEFYCSSVTGNRSLSYYSDGINPNPSSPPTGTLRAYISNIVLGGITVSCPAPTVLLASNITSSSADLNWTDNAGASQWDIELGLNGFTPTGTPTQSSVSKPYTYTGLSSNTAYQYYVRADCGGGDYSSWVGPYSFTTACGAASATFSENFNAVTAPNLPSCWDEIGDVVTRTSTYYSSPNCAEIYTAEYLISPELNDLASGTNQVRFYARGWSSGVVLSVGTITDPANSATYSEVQSIALTTTYTEYIVPFYSTTNDYFVFKYSSGSSVLLLDDVVYEPQPTCPDPSDLLASSITSNSADLNWTDNAGASLWDIELGLNGFTPTGTPTQSSVTNPYTYTGISSNTAYQYYVRADCGGGDFSGWIGPFNFTTLESCPDPSGLSVSNITSSSADLNWTENGTATTWEIEYGLDGFTQGSGTTIPGISSKPYTISGLTSNTSYDYYVRSDCGGGDYSSWIGPFSFNTPCAEYTVPYFEGFESGYTNGATIAGCLTQQSVVGTATWMANSSNTTYNRTPRSGSFNTTLYYGNTDWIFIPINLNSGTNYTVSLFARQDGATSTNANITVKYGTTASEAGMTNTIVAATGIINGTYQEITGDFSPASSGTFYIGILGYINYSPYYISMDDISIIEGPTCPDPSDLSATNITATTADLNWTENGIATSWEIEIGVQGFSPTGTATHIGVWKPFPMSGLLSDRTYSYYVRADCGGGDYSNWVGPYNFTTLESCPDPAGLSASNITSSTADLNWTENGTATTWEIEYGLDGFTQGSGTTIPGISSKPYTISGLSSNTSYDYYVRSDCGGSDYSSWVGPYSFNTPCAEYTVPYFEGFESGYTNGATIAGCLTQQSIVGAETWMANSSNTDYNRTPRTGSFNATLKYSNSDWVFIPISLTAGKTYEISLFARQDGSTTSNASITISYGTSASAAGMTNSIVALTGLTSGNYQEISGEFSPSSTGIYYVGIFGAINGTPWYISMDDISIVELTPMSYVSSITSQNTDYTYPADTDHHIIGIEIETFGYISPLAATQFNINMNGSTDISDVDNIKLYYSGASSSFSTSNLFGTVSPASGTLSINGTQTLIEGTNYFWLSYDIASDATINNYVDAECVEITMNGGIGSQVPTTTAPSGNCQILDVIACEHKITLYDYENDGWGTYWNGSAVVNRTVNVLVDGTPVLTNLNLASGDNGTSYTFIAEAGATISTVVYGGSGQMQYVITGGNGDFILEDGINQTVPTGKTGTATCDFQSLFSLNGDAYFSGTSGSKANSTGTEITLTSDIKNQKSSAWFNYMLDLSEDFEIDFIMNFGNRNAGDGADGIVFSLQGDCLSCGGTGLSIGYGGISPSIGIEFDTYYNASMTDYAPSGEWDHIAMFKNGSNDHAGANVLAAPVGLAQDASGNVGITDGADYNATVKWTASSNLLEVFWNGSPTATISYTDDIINNIFGGSSMAYWGFTSGTGTGTNKHTVKVTTLPTITSAAQLQDVEITQGSTYQSELYDFASSYTWTPNDGTISNTAIHNPVFSPTVTTTYCCDIEDDCGNVIKDCFTLTVNTILPVELISFAADCVTDEVILSWETASESNCDFFAIQTSLDMITWHDIGIVKASGTSNQLKAYRYSEIKKVEQPVYYRLKVYDYDGTYSYSTFVEVNCQNDGFIDVSIYPNPVKNELFVRFTNSKSEVVKLFITNSIGQVVYKTSFYVCDFNSEFVIDVSNLKDGLYMLNFVSDHVEIKFSKKIVKTSD